MRQRCFWNSEEGVTSCWSWGPNPALDNQCTMVKTLHLIIMRFPRRIQWLKFYEFLRNTFEVLRGRQHLSVTEEQCPEQRVEPETQTADDSLRQRGATVRSWPYQGCLMPHELTRLSESKQHSSSLSSPQAHCEVFKTATSAGQNFKHLWSLPTLSNRYLQYIIHTYIIVLNIIPLCLV